MQADPKILEIINGKNNVTPAMPEKVVLTPEQIFELQSYLKEAQTDVTPFPVVQEEELSIIGDANKTEVKYVDMVMGFRTPKELFERKNVKADNVQTVGAYYVYEMEYKNCTITPRHDVRILGALLKVIPFFLKAREENNGSLEFASPEELIFMMATCADDIVLAMYNVVGAFLRIDDELGQCMFPAHVFNCLAIFFKTYPEALNEADLFFGLSIGKR